MLLAVVLAAGCLAADAPADTSAPPSTLTPTAEGIRFIATGDTGTGDDAQLKVARTIEAVCAARGCDFMVILGDLIYETGVSSANDPQFESKFEEPYRNLTFPIYGVLGNHDNSNDPVTGATGTGVGLGHWYASGDHMVAYHYRTDRLSEKWQMPDRYYSVRFGDVEFFALDTNTMMFLDAALGSTNPQAYQDALAQGSWLDGALDASDAAWKITWSHHPYVSNGQHGNAGSYDGMPAPVPGYSGDHVKRFFDDHVCGRVQVHMAGHDHDLQWLKPVPSCGATEFIVSGAGAQSRTLADPTDDAYFGVGETNGFYWIEMVGDELRATIYDADGAVLFERTLMRGEIA